MNKALLVAFEGIHGSGKSSLIRKLSDYLEKTREVVTTKWNSFEMITEVVRSLRTTGNLQNPNIHFMAQLADFTLRHEMHIKPALLADKIVLADRYFLTGIIRGNVRGLDKYNIQSAYSFALPPALWIILDTPPDIALARSRPQCDQIWRVGMGKPIGSPHTLDELAYLSYQQKCYDQYLDIGHELGATIISGNQSQDEIFQEALSAITPLLQG